MSMSTRSAKMMLLVCASIVFNFQFSMFASAQAQSDSVVRVGLPGGPDIEMVWVEGGAFTMGSNGEKGVSHQYEDSRPEHQVTVGGYYIGRHEVMQGLWTAVMGENPSKFRGNDSLPVESVSWEDAQRFVARLSELTGKRFRLPTEAEWEYAARGGVNARRQPFAGCARGDLEKHSWFCVNSGRRTHAAGSLQPNELGLYDMGGNVAEWCQDWMEKYPSEAQENPQGPTSGDSRVLRGGHYNSVSWACAVYDRSWYVPTGKSEYYGLRVVMEVGE